jgi:predicted amidohydrolase YtcJ
LGRERELGSLEPGTRADLAVLSDDPLAVDPDRVASIAVLQTWVDGVCRHAAAQPVPSGHAAAPPHAHR